MKRQRKGKRAKEWEQEQDKRKRQSDRKKKTDRVREKEGDTERQSRITLIVDRFDWQVKGSENHFPLNQLQGNGGGEAGIIW